MKERRRKGLARLPKGAGEEQGDSRPGGGRGVRAGIAQDAGDGCGLGVDGVAGFWWRRKRDDPGGPALWVGQDSGRGGVFGEGTIEGRVGLPEDPRDGTTDGRNHRRGHELSKFKERLLRVDLPGHFCLLLRAGFTSSYRHRGGLA